MTKDDVVAYANARIALAKLNLKDAKLANDGLLTTRYEGMLKEAEVLRVNARADLKRATESTKRAVAQRDGQRR